MGDRQEGLPRLARARARPAGNPSGEPGLKALIVGGTGFLGLAIARRLAGEGYEVAGTCRRPRREAVPPYRPENLHVLDVTDERAVDWLLARTRPERIVHLAAVSNVPEVTRQPSRSTAINVLGVVHVLAAATRHAPSARAVVFGSGTVYEGADPARCPWDEDVPISPRTIYGATKAAAEEIARAYCVERGLAVVLARPFNQIGPGQGPEFAVSRFARSAARIALGLDPPRLPVGNLEARRDFTDVRDLARAVPRLLEDGRPGAVYNLASGVARRIGDVLDALLARAGVAPEVLVDPELHRPLDVPVSAGDASLAGRELGWRPEIPFETTLDDCLAEWRRRETTPQEVR